MNTGVGSQKLFFESVRIGDELPPMVKPPIDRVQLARYAGATGDFSPIWLDDGFAKGIGMPSVMAPPGLALGFLGQLITEWAKGAQLKDLTVRLTRTLWPGDVLVCRGRVFDRAGQNGRYFLDLEVWAENQRGELVAKGHAVVKVFYSPEDEQRFLNDEPPVMVEVPRSSLLTVAPTAPMKKRATQFAKPPAPLPPAKSKGRARVAKAPQKKKPRSR